jgi:peptide/nickel transport system permease protein
LVVGLVAAALAVALAVLIGVSGPVLGGWSDEILSLLTNAMLVIPTLPLVVVIAGYIKGSGSLVVALVIAVTGWSWSARIFRAQTLSLRRREFVLASRASGETTARIVNAEIMPHLVPLIAAQFLGVVLYAILTQAGLAFLGVGSVSDWSWGTMLYWANSADAFQLGQWWWYAPPGLCIALFGTGLVFMNSAVDNLTDARQRGGKSSRWRVRRRQSEPSAPLAGPPDLLVTQESTS